MIESKPTSMLKRSDRFWFPCMVAGLAILFVVLLHATWLKWGDPVVDTGRELEIPWKMAEGEMLYRDMAYNYGPFSPWVNALFLKLFGTNLISIVMSGILCALSGLLLVFLVSRVFLTKRMSIAVAAIFLFESVFQHYYYNGNFCFILPYSFCAVHAMLAALCAFLFLSRHIDNSGSKPLVGAGLCLGICFLCKIEIAGAIAVPVALVPVVIGAKSGKGLKRIAGDALCWIVPMLVVGLGGFAPYFFHASVGQVLWENVLKPQLVDFRSNVFFMQHLGLSHLQHNLYLIGLSLLIWTVFLAALLFCVSRFTPNQSNPFSRGASVILAAAAAIWMWRDLNWEIEFRCVPVALIAVFFVALVPVLFRKGAPSSTHSKLLAFSLFAGLSLMRIFLTAGTFHYGFCLAVPGVILFAVVLVRLIPGLFPVLVGNSRLFGALMIVVLLVLSVRNFSTASMDNFNDRTVLIEGPRGKLWVQPKPLGLDIHLALQMMEELTQDGQTLLVLPEGALVNFITGMRNPTYYNLFTPPELNSKAENEVIRQIRENAVDWILLVNRPVWEFGSRGLGVDYGMKLMAFVEEQYVRSISFGPEPYSGPEQGGCVLYRIKR